MSAGGWATSRLGDLVTFHRGVSYKKEQAKSEPAKGLVPVLRAGNLQDGRIIWDDLVYVPSTVVRDEQLMKVGDVVVAMSSGSASVVGKAASVTLADAEHKGAFGAFCGLWRPRAADTGWLRHYFQSPEYKAAVFNAALGVNINNLRAEHIASLELPLPPEHEQRRIVAKLDDVLARSRRAKQALDAVPPLLEKLRQSILAAAFRGDLTADWRAKNPDVEPADALLARIRTERRKKWEESELAKLKAKGKPPTDDRWKAKYKEPEPVDASELPELPKGWCWATIDLVGHLLLGRRRAADEYIEGVDGRVMRPYVRVANVKRDRLDLSDVLSMPFSPEELALYTLERGDVILSEGQSAELVGQSAIYEGGVEHLCIQATVHRFRAYESGTTSEFAQLVFLHHLLSGAFRAAAALTTNIAHLTSERLKPLPFPLPPLAEQRLIVRRTRAALAIDEHLRRRATQARTALTSLDSALLARAFSGELIPRLVHDELAGETVVGDGSVVAMGHAIENAPLERT